MPEATANRWTAWAAFVLERALGAGAAAVAVSVLAAPVLADGTVPTARGAATVAAAERDPPGIPHLVIRQPWARATPVGMKNGAAYLTIMNRSAQDDRLVAAASDVAGRLELHRTEMDDKGVMRMRMLSEIPIPAGTTVRIAPGGYHLMLVGLVDPLEEGETFALRLQFEKAGTREVTVRVRGLRAMPGDGHGGQ